MEKKLLGVLLLASLSVAATAQTFDTPPRPAVVPGGAPATQAVPPRTVNPGAAGGVTGAAPATGTSGGTGANITSGVPVNPGTGATSGAVVNPGMTPPGGAAGTGTATGVPGTGTATGTATGTVGTGTAAGMPGTDTAAGTSGTGTAAGMPGPGTAAGTSTGTAAGTSGTGNSAGSPALNRTPGSPAIPGNAANPSSGATSGATTSQGAGATAAGAAGPATGGALRFDATSVPGWSMMTPQEQQTYTERMNSSTTVGQCRAYHEAYMAQMRTRARGMGQTLDAQPSNPCSMMQKQGTLQQ